MNLKSHERGFFFLVIQLTVYTEPSSKSILIVITGWLWRCDDDDVMCHEMIFSGCLTCFSSALISDLLEGIFKMFKSQRKNE